MLVNRRLFDRWVGRGRIERQAVRRRPGVVLQIDQRRSSSRQLFHVDVGGGVAIGRVEVGCVGFEYHPGAISRQPREEVPVVGLGAAIRGRSQGDGPRQQVLHIDVGGGVSVGHVQVGGQGAEGYVHAVRREGRNGTRPIALGARTRGGGQRDSARGQVLHIDIGSGVSVGHVQVGGQGAEGYVHAVRREGWNGTRPIALGA